MNRTFYLTSIMIFLLVISLIAGCGSSGGTGGVPDPVATNTPNPGATNTPNPGATNTPVPTNTPAIHLTTISGEEITVDTTWTKAQSPYLVTGKVYIRNSAKLTIEPGVTVYFQGSTGIFVGKQMSNGYEDSSGAYYLGSLSAVGTSGSPITFTSSLSISSSAASPGQWYGIYFGDGTIDGSSRLDYCNISYAGQTYTDSWFGFTMKSNIGCRYSSPGISNCTITNSAGEGIALLGSSPSITVNNINNNGGYGIKAEVLSDTKSAPTITGNTINNNNCPIKIGCQECPRAGNTISGNISNYIDITGGEMTSATTWDITGVPYIINNPVYVRNSATFTISPGVVVKFNPSTGIFVGKQMSNGYEDSSGAYYLGALSAVGTSGSQITFTSASPSPSAGNWYGIYFGDGTIDGSSRLSYCNIRYGGQVYTDSWFSFTMQFNVGCRKSSPGISNCTISNSGLNGIQLRQTSSPSITSDTISNNGGYGIYCTTTCGPTMSGNIYSGNTSGNTYGSGSD